MLLKVWLLLGILTLPQVSLAQFGVVDTLAIRVVSFINGVLIPLVVATALLVFIWGMFIYFIHAGGEESHQEQGRKLIIWSIIGFTMLAAIFAVVNLLAGGILSALNQPNVAPDFAPLEN